MDGLRVGLKKLLDSNPVINALKPAGFVFLLLLPIVDLIGAIVFVRFLYAITGILFLMWLFGLLVCFAESTDWAMGTAFTIHAVAYLITLIRHPSLNNVIYFLLCGVIAFWFLRLVYRKASARSETGSSGAAAADRGGAANLFCSQCGSSIPSDSAFCPFCGHNISGRAYGVGTSYSPTGGSGYAPASAPTGYSAASAGYSPAPGGYAPASSGSFRPTQSGASDVLTKFCGGTFSLIFSILLSVYLIFSLISSPWISIVSSIPLIIICIGCWLVYTGCVRKSPGTVGFSLIGGGLMALEIVWIVVMALGIVTGLVLIIGFGFFGVGLTLMIGCAVGLILFILYYNGLRRTSVSARAILQDGGTEWRTSLFSVVMICIGAVGSAVAVVVLRWLRNLVVDLLSGFFGYRTANEIMASLFRQSGLSVLTLLLSLGVAVCAVVILLLIRRADAQLHHRPR